LAIFGNCWGDVKCLKNAYGTGVMPQDMTKSVLVSFKGEMQLGIARRDLVIAILLNAIQAGQLTVATDPAFVKVPATVEMSISILAKISGRP
jgi:aconitase B